MASAVDPTASFSEPADRLNDEIERDAAEGLTPTNIAFETLSKVGAPNEPMILSPAEIKPHPEPDRLESERDIIASKEPEERKTKMDHDQERASPLVNGLWKPTDTPELRGQETVHGSLSTSKLGGVWIKSDKHHHLNLHFKTGLKLDRFIFNLLQPASAEEPIWAQLLQGLSIQSRNSRVGNLWNGWLKPKFPKNLFKEKAQRRFLSRFSTKKKNPIRK